MNRDPSQFELTQHAALRLQQRGIKADTVALLQAYGRRVYDHRGAARLIFDKAARCRIRSALGKAAAQLNFSAYAVVDAARRDTFITVEHRRNGRVREYS